MYLADYHVHTAFSPDGKHSLLDMAEAAVRAGLQELCFTDHVEPMDWKTLQRRQPYDWQAFVQEWEEVQSKLGRQIKLRMGVELGDILWDEPYTRQLLKDAPEWDFSIGSIHLLSRAYDCLDLYDFQPKDEEEARLGIADYLKQTQDLAQRGNFSVLGHLTLPLRYLNELYGFSMSFDGFEGQVEHLLRTLIRNDCGIELNTNRGNGMLPDRKWLCMYRDLGGRLITVGTDAHRPEHVGMAVVQAQQLLRSCGFDAFCTYEKGQPIFHRLSV